MASLFSVEGSDFLEAGRSSGFLMSSILAYIHIGIKESQVF